MVVMTRVEICFLSLQEVSFLYFLGMGDDNGIHASDFVLYRVRIFYTQTQPNRVSSIHNTNPIRPETLLIIPNVSAVSRITIQLIPVNDFILQSATARKQF